MRALLTIAALAAASLAAGCTHPAQMALSFGDSVEAMHRAQTIPTEATQQPPEGGGASGALAQRRYETGTTKPLLSSSTSTTNNSSN